MITCTLSFARQEREILFRNGNEHLRTQSQNAFHDSKGTGHFNAISRSELGSNIVTGQDEDGPENVESRDVEPLRIKSRESR